MSKSIHIIDLSTSKQEEFMSGIFFYHNTSEFLKHFDKSISLAIVSIDNYESTKFKLDSIYDLIYNNGIILVTNYVNENKRVVDEFINDFELTSSRIHNITFIRKHIPTFEVPSSDDIDFDDYFAKIHQVLSSRRNTTSNCTLPASSIVLTVSNYRMMPMLLLQHESMKLYNQLDCLSNLLVTLCMDKKCYRECQLHGLLNCAYVKTKYAMLPTSSFAFKQDAYGYVNFLKVVIHHATLGRVDSFFFFEADVLLYRNPWDVKDVLNGRTFDGTVVPNSYYDFMYQREWPYSRKNNDLSCGGGLNGGQYYFKSTKPSRAFLDALITDRNETIAKLGRADQDFFITTALNYGVRLCTLPANIFAAHCKSMRTFNHPISESITYHAVCSSGMEDKAFYMKEHIRCMTECPSSRYSSDKNKICDLPYCKFGSSSSDILSFFVVATIFVVVLLCAYGRVVRVNQRIKQ